MNNLSFLQTGLLVVFAVLVSIGLPIVIGYVTLWPVDRAIRGVRRRTQFLMSDFFWLMIQLQAVLAFTVNRVPGGRPEMLVSLLAFSTFAVVAMWYGASVSLTRAAVEQLRRRAVFIL